MKHENFGDAFLILCKELYFEKTIPPFSKSNMNNEKLLNLITIAKKYFKNDEYDKFAEFFQEGQYFIQLWTAHLILEYGRPDKDLQTKSIEIIKDYSDNPLAPEVAKEELKWLKENAYKYKNNL